MPSAFSVSVFTDFGENSLSKVLTSENKSDMLIVEPVSDLREIADLFPAYPSPAGSFSFGY